MIYDHIKDLGLKVIVEAGGNIGTDTVKLCDMFPEATIHTLEPLKILREHILMFEKENLKLYEDAFNTYTGSTRFFIDMNPAGLHGASSILEVSEHYLSYVGKEKEIVVPCITLSDFMDREKIEHIDFLWLDIEMMEYNVLKASKRRLKDIDNIYTEISYSNFREGQPEPDDIHFLLIDNGFTRIFIESQGSEDFAWQANALYRRK